MSTDLWIGIFGVLITLFFILFSSRRNAYEKDFFYINPSIKVRRLLYWRNLPACEIALWDIIFRILLHLTLMLQIISLFGVCFLPPIFDIVGMEKYIPLVINNRYMHTLMTWSVFVILAMPMMVYLLIVGVFAPKRIVHAEVYIK